MAVSFARRRLCADEIVALRAQGHFPGNLEGLRLETVTLTACSGAGKVGGIT